MVEENINLETNVDTDKSLDNVRGGLEIDQNITEVDKVMLKLLDNPKFYKVLSLNQVGAKVGLDVSTLSDLEIDTLLSERYLNATKISENPYGRVKTALVGFVLEQAEVNHKVLNLRWHPEEATIISADSDLLINRLNQTIKSRIEARDQNIYLINKVSSEFQSEFDEVYHAKLTPSLEALAKLRTYLFLRSGKDKLTDQDVQEIADDLNMFDELEERNSHLPSIGLEVEFPYMGNTKSDNPSIKLVAMMEYLPLLNTLGIPTEDDKQGEVALPKSNSVELQLYLLELIHRVGYLPVDSSGTGTPNYTLHINIGLPEGSSFDARLGDQYGYSFSQFEEFQTLGVVTSALYSTRGRINNGAYGALIQPKGNDVGEHRIELRSFSYDPHNTFEENLQKLSDIRAIVTPAVYKYTDAGDIMGLGELYNNWIADCQNLFLTVDRGYRNKLKHYASEQVVLSLMEDSATLESLRKITDEYIFNVNRITDQNSKDEDHK